MASGQPSPSSVTGNGVSSDNRSGTGPPSRWVMTTSTASEGIRSGSRPTGLGVSAFGEATPELTFENAAPVVVTRSCVAIGVTAQSAG